MLGLGAQQLLQISFFKMTKFLDLFGVLHIITKEID